jgi:tRNA/rRNA methyltransferase
VNVYFILVKPAVPENIGAAARAVHNMGFRFLRLVSPCNHLQERAQWMAHGARAVLKNARVYPALDRAVRDMDFLVGTTARRRHILKASHFPIDDLPGILRKKPSHVRKLGLVFGCEKHGLSNSDIALCDVMTFVPMAQVFPSLNLAQAVMVYAYEIHRFMRGRKAAPQAKAGPKGQYKALKKRVHLLFGRIGIQPQSLFYKKMVMRLALLGQRDVRLAHFLIKQFEGKLHLLH